MQTLKSLAKQHYHIAYRPDIDGLRAIAILAVVIFHAFPNFLPGGFIGVDVFFVISGYLISKIIFTDLNAEKFYFGRFYANRIRRIFPALITILIICYAVGWFILLPDEFKQLGHHIEASSGFFQNIVLWKESGYFDNATEFKPLMHLWSLSVEEQFYLVFPFLVFLVWKTRFNVVFILFFILILSFYQNVTGMKSDPVKDFYAPQSRLWEMLAGSILAYSQLFSLASNNIVTRNGNFFKISISTKFKKIKNNIFNGVSFFGLLSLAFGLLWIDRDKLFPGWLALIPVVGAFMLIAAGSDAWINRKFLSNKLMLFIGKISYPLYLWHWILLSFPQIVENKAPGFSIRLLAILLSVLLAWVTFKMIESPIRFGKKSAGGIWVLGVVLFCIGLTGFVTFEMDGLDFRGDMKSLQHTYSGLSLYAPNEKLQDCSHELQKIGFNYCKQSSTNLPSLAMVGDSHAEHLFYGTIKSSQDNWILLGNSSCPPTMGIEVTSTSAHDCKKFMFDIFSYLARSENIKTVALSYFGGYASDKDFAADHVIKNNGPAEIKVTGDYESSKEGLFFSGLNNSINFLEKNNKDVILIVDIPELPFFPRSCLSRPFFSSEIKNCTLDRKVVDKRQEVMRKEVKRLASLHPRMRVFDTLPYLCNESVCNVFINNELIYRDSHHLGIYGSKYLGGEFVRWLDSAHGKREM
ncbi:MAG: acyltransferase [Mucilaginibacter sp.]|nr:acyltransferase [Mucilaginibacter sp.]